MKKKDQSSTEQLLQIVRGNALQGTTPRAHTQRDSEQYALQSLPFKSAKLVVDIQDSTLCILAVEQNVAHPTIKRFLVSIPSDVKKDDEKLSELLRTQLTYCTASCRTVEVWSLLHPESFFQILLEVPALKGPQLDKAIFWSLKKQFKEIDEKTHFIDYKIKRGIDADKSKLTVEATVATLDVIKHQKQLFATIGFSLQGIIAEQTAVNLAVQAIPEYMESSLSLHIDNDFSCISLYQDNSLVFSRTIRTGAASFKEALSNSEYEGQADSLFAAHEINTHYPQSEEVFKLIEPVALRIARQIERTISLGRNKKIPQPKKIYISGHYAWEKKFIKFFANEVNITTSTLPIPLPQQLAMNLFDATSKQDAAFTTSFASLFVQQFDGINLCYDFKARHQLATKRKITIATISALASLVLTLGILFGYQYTTNLMLQTKVAQLNAELDAMKPYLTHQMLMKEMAELEVKRKQATKLGQNFAAPAVLSQLNTFKRYNIRLIDTKYIAGTHSISKKGSKKKRFTTDGRISLEGIVIGDSHTFDTILAMYIADIGKSPFFSVPKITHREQRETPTLGKVLHFGLQCDLLGKGEL